ncbi:MAG: hypothetical protein ACR2F0_09200 [Chthoniobacterales bacterium]
MSRVLILTLALLLAACFDQKSLLRKITPPEDDALAQHFLELVKSGNYAEATAMLDESIRAQADAALWQMRVVLDHGQPISFETINANKIYFQPWNGAAKTNTNLAYEIRFADSWALAEVVVVSENSQRKIVSAHVWPVKDSLRVLNQFDFHEKSLPHYLVFAVCLLVPAFIITALVLCIRSRVRRRWLWFIFILFGFGALQFNWTTGGGAVQLLSFSLLGTGFMRSGLYGPWILKVSVPVGAILFLILRHRLPRQEDPPVPLPRS